MSNATCEIVPNFRNFVRNVATLPCIDVMGFGIAHEFAFFECSAESSHHRFFYIVNIFTVNHKDSCYVQNALSHILV